jgi:hypothetical protein
MLVEKGSGKFFSYYCGEDWGYFTIIALPFFLSDPAKDISQTFLITNNLANFLEVP